MLKVAPIELQRSLQAKKQWQVTPFRELSQTNWLIIGFGPTPISGNGEIRMPSPCNVFAVTEDDVMALRSVRPGSQISVTAVAPAKLPPPIWCAAACR
mgnify:CR=1 FL=1